MWLLQQFVPTYVLNAIQEIQIGNKIKAYLSCFLSMTHIYPDMSTTLPAFCLSFYSARLDLVIVPLRVEFRVFAKIKICIWKCFTKTLFDKLLWAFQLKTIEINIFKYKDIEPDTSPPLFSVYDTAVCITLIWFS